MSLREEIAKAAFGVFYRREMRHATEDEVARRWSMEYRAVGAKQRAHEMADALLPLLTLEIAREREDYARFIQELWKPQDALADIKESLKQWGAIRRARRDEPAP